jgi:hypothetical protein
MNYLPLAEQCGLVEEHPVNHSSVEYLADLQRFAELVAAHEREECAKVCEAQYRDYEWAIHERDGADSCAAAIRARGQG